MQGKTVNESSVIMTQVMTLQDVNLGGNVHGGVIMRLVDNAGGLVAVRHTRANVVTASIDRLDFHHPVFAGDLVTLRASLNLVSRTSIEVGVNVQAENPKTGEVNHTASAYLTYVALDESRKPMEVPPLILETEEQRRRNREAQARREDRLHKRQKKQE